MEGRVRACELEPKDATLFLKEGLRAFRLWREHILADKERREALDGQALDGAPW